MNLADMRLDEFLRMVNTGAQAAHAPALAPARMLPTERALPEPYRRMSPQEARARLRSLKSEAVQRASNQRWSDAESKEWAALSREHRMCLHLLAGIDGDLPELALREWRELPEPERVRIKAELRAMRQAMKGVFSLSGNW
ncbi:hypothetical protein [Comamonas antarctica]|uniref:Uncharacterized protein n=1 Tax=Comamonas antarctica TaxID=2743470 RepID=A0A6N1X046_9BURK|nr:hypothetical protein [Comamonas antarctica]QKV52627.1 hypothetical protein HUK68_06760 [Comamonas antarctica]